MAVSARIEKQEYQRFLNILRIASREVEDLRIPLSQIAKRFLESRKFIFDERAGPGQYKDLSWRYKIWKTTPKSKGGGGKSSPYPILLLSGRLAKSITNEGGENITKVGAKSLEIGTRVPYGAKHQKGRGVPKRDPL